MITALIGVASCTKPSAVPENESPPPMAVPVVTEQAPAQAKMAEPTQDLEKKSADSPKEKTTQVNWLAKLDSIQNRVEFRQRNESIWKPSVLGMSFERFDALQTQSQSAAKVMYQSGSKLDVRGNTLLIFDHDPGKKKKKEDRVIVKSGELTGTTKTELWVFTNAGLVQIKPEAKNRVAKAQVTVINDSKSDKQGDQKIKVKVDAGTAEVLFKRKDTFEKVLVAPQSDVEITSSAKLIDSNNTVVAAQLEEVSAASANPVKTVKAELSVDQPADGTVTTDTEVEVKGRLSAVGGKLLINGELTELKDDLSFAKKIKLQPGSNLIVFQVVRSDASVQFMRRNIRLQAGQ